MLRRSAERRPRLTAWDRLVFVVLYRLYPQVLDAVAMVFGETHLCRIVSMHASYYNGTRTHLSVGKDAPISRAIVRFGPIICRAHGWWTTSPLRANLVFGRDRGVTFQFPIPMATGDDAVRFRHPTSPSPH